MKIKKGDNVKVISGKDKGKTGAIAYAFPKEGKVIIEGVNVKKRHMKARRGGQKGQMVEKAMPIDVSTVQLIDPKSGKVTRVGFSIISGKKERVARKGGSKI